MGFSQAIRSCFSQYITFSGRAPRSELWYFVLFAVIVFVPLSLLSPVLGGIAMVPFVVPGISVEVRRLHDTDRSGWWVWIALLPIIGQIVKLIWYCSQGTDGSNRFGPDPLGAVRLTQPAHTSSADAISITEKADNLAKLKALLEAGTISQGEFDRMKADLLG